MQSPVTLDTVAFENTISEGGTSPGGRPSGEAAALLAADAAMRELVEGSAAYDTPDSMLVLWITVVAPPVLRAYRKWKSRREEP